MNSKWQSLLSIKCILSSSCGSVGDALREIDSRGEIRSDPFILVSGDVVSNVNLSKAIDFHKERKKIDSDTAMTVILKKSPQTSPLRPMLDDLRVAFDRQSCQIVSFDNNCDNDNFSIPLEIVKMHPSIAIRADLLDCHIDICSPEFLNKLSDEFDYQVGTISYF